MNPNRLHQSFLGSYHLCRGSRRSERASERAAGVTQTLKQEEKRAAETEEENRVCKTEDVRVSLGRAD